MTIKKKLDGLEGLSVIYKMYYPFSKQIEYDQ